VTEREWQRLSVLFEMRAEELYEMDLNIEVAEVFAAYGPEATPTPIKIGGRKASPQIQKRPVVCLPTLFLL